VQWELNLHLLFPIEALPFLLAIQYVITRELANNGVRRDARSEWAGGSVIEKRLVQESTGYSVAIASGL
jgi:hypothetical protein